MLTKVIYDSTIDLYYTKFLSLKKGTLVVPGPEIADLWREELLKANIELPTTTYADWIKSLCHEYGANSDDIITKSELLDHLHRLWCNLGAPDNFALFQYVFDLYTEVKSITTDQEIFKQILEIETSLSNEVIEGLSQFYSLKVINDEYQVIRTLIEKIQPSFKSEIIDKPELHIFGFKILSALQIELLQTMAKKQNIYIYVSRHLDRIVTEHNLNDWVTWIREDKKVVLEPYKKNQQNTHFICSESDFVAIWGNLKGKKVTLLSNSKELPLANWGHQNSSYLFKTPSEAGKSGSAYVMKLIQELMMKRDVTWEEVNEFVISKYQQVLSAKEEYPVLKWLQYIKNWIREKNQYIEKSNIFSWLDFGILKTKIDLDAVRLFWYQYSEEKIALDIKVLSLGVFLNPEEENILLINDSLASGSSQELLSLKSSAILKSLAPSVSDDWHKWWMESLIYDYLAQAKSNFMIINFEALQFDLFLKQLLIERDFIKANVTANLISQKESPNLRVIQPSRITIVSPSSLLMYKNCPKQYYVNNIEKLFVDDKFQVLLTEGKKGEIYHALLQEIGKDKEKVILYLNDPQALSSYLTSHPDFNLDKNESALAEITQIVRHTLEFWKEMPVFESEWEVVFEQEFQNIDFNMKGRIDFVAYHEKLKILLIIDFKKSTVPKISEIERYDHWQILCYFKGWKDKYPDKPLNQVILGYWNLSSVEDSVFISNTDVSFKLPVTISKLKSDWDDLHSNFESHWQGYFSSLQKEIEFLPKPKNLNVCTYCILNTSCEKGTLV